MTLNQYNEVAYPLSFTAEKEKEGNINFLDISIHRELKCVEFGINTKKQLQISSFQWTPSILENIS
jgi:hypothetical protein